MAPITSIVFMGFINQLITWEAPDCTSIVTPTIGVIIQQKHVFQGTAPYLAKLVNRTPISLGFMLDILSLIIFIRRLTTAKPLGLEFHQFTNSTDVLGNRSLGFDPLWSRTKKSSGCFHMQLDPQ